MTNRRRLLSAFHGLARRLGLDEAARRDKLERSTGVRSAADLDARQLLAVIAAWSRDLPAGERDAAAGARARAAAQEPHQRRVKALWIGLYNLAAIDDGSDAALDAFVARQTGIAALRFLHAEAAPSVIEALKSIADRHGWVPRDEPMAVTKLGQTVYTTLKADTGLAWRRALVRRQWQRLAELGAVQIKSRFALDAWLKAARIVAVDSALEALAEAQLDAAARKLGTWLRRAEARAAASAQRVAGS